MGPATHIGLNRALLDFSNRLVPFLTEQRFCGRVVYSGGDDVMAVLPLEDLSDYLLSLRAAWCGGGDPYKSQPGDPDVLFESRGGYWLPTSENNDFQGLPNRPLFTMGEGATMSLGIVIAHKSVPLPAALEALWEAESDRAKEMKGTSGIEWGELGYVPPKNGLCFRVLYGSGNCLEALIKGELYEGWRRWMDTENYQALSGLLYRLAEELPRHAAFTPDSHLIAKAAGAIARRRDEADAIAAEIELLLAWLERWEDWARPLHSGSDGRKPPGIDLADLANILRFSAFWLDKLHRREQWHADTEETP
jgi:CRISPR-associated protein Cmr2